MLCCVQTSTLLEALPMDMLQDPSSDSGWTPDNVSLEQAHEAIRESKLVFPRGKPLVVVFCTDGARSLPVRHRSCWSTCCSVHVQCMRYHVSQGAHSWVHADGSSLLRLRAHAGCSKQAQLRVSAWSPLAVLAVQVSTRSSSETEF